VETFDEASEEFQRFARSNGYPDRLYWISKGDRVFLRRRLFVRFTGSDGRAEASQHFRDASVRTFGVCLRAVSTLEGRTVCIVYAPQSSQEAHERMIPPNEVKYMAHHPPLPAAAVRSWLWWMLLRACARVSRRSADWILN
jgi:hypothetical protein